jgi:hypothetical protein
VGYAKYESGKLCRKKMVATKSYQDASCVLTPWNMVECLKRGHPLCRLKELVLSFHACHMNQTSRQYMYASITHKEVSLTDNGVFKHVKVLSRQRGICIQGEMKVIGTCNTTIMCVCSLAPMFSACNIEKVGQR